MGIPLHAVMLNNKGLALARLGRYGDAKAALRQAKREAPFLAEASQNLIAANACSGGPLPAVLSPWRIPPHLQPIKHPDGSETQQPTDVFDVSAGVDGALTDIQYPQDAEHAADAYDPFNDLRESAGQHASNLGNEKNQLSGRFIASHPSRLTSQRTADIEFQVLDLEANQNNPRLAALLNTAQALEAPVGSVRAELDQDLGDAGEACGADVDCYQAKCHQATVRRQSEWLADMQAYDSAYRNYFRAYYRYASGLAANLSDPNSHQAALDLAAIPGDGIVEDLALETMNWSQEINARGCPEAPQPVSESNNPNTPASPACPDSIKAIKLSAKFNIADAVVKGRNWPLKFGITCEKVDIEGATPGPLAGFIQGSRNLRKGTTTVFIGIKGGLGLPGVPVEVGVKVGAYVTLDSNNEISDGGWRVAPSAKGSIGPIDLSANAPPVDFSFAGQWFD